MSTVEEQHQPSIGAWAWHRENELDAREVVAIRPFLFPATEDHPDGAGIKLRVSPAFITGWVPADNYTYTRGHR